MVDTADVIEADSVVAVLTYLCGQDVCWRFTGRDDIVMTTVTGPDDIAMIEAGTQP